MSTYSSNKVENVRLPPRLKETVINGVKVFEMIERGPFSLSTFQGIVSSGILPMTSGTMIPQLNDIFSAVAAMGSIPTASALSGLPGSIMNVSNLLSKFTDQQKKDLEKSMPKDVYQYFQTIMNNTTGIEMSATLDGKRIDEETFVKNAYEYLLTAKSTSDILNFFEKIKTDDVFNGASMIKDVAISVTGTFGNQILNISASGGLKLDSEAAFTKLAESFASSLPSSLSGVFSNFSTVLQSMQPSVASGITEVIETITRRFTNSRKEG